MQKHKPDAQLHRTHLRTVDILVNSAGINRLIPAEEYDDQTFQTVMDINIASLHRITREVGNGL